VSTAFRAVLIWAAFLFLATPARADVSLEYEARYLSQPSRPDHIVDVEAVGDSLVLVATNLAVTLVDPAAVPSGGTHDYLGRLDSINARDLAVLDGRFIYTIVARTHSVGGPGLAVIERSGAMLTRGWQITEPEVVFESLCLADSLLYVALHAHGIRVYSIADPAEPALVGALETGLTDAFAIEVVGDTAYVADGGGGLKVLDVSDPSDPVLVTGETTASAVGTALDVTVRGGHVYVALGGAGVAVYRDGDIDSRVVAAAGPSVVDLAWVGDRLAVADLGGIRLYDVGPDGGLTETASEVAARRGHDASELRIARAVAPLGDDRVLAADWSALDIYRVVPTASASVPDASPLIQRVRFDPSGGVEELAVVNQGGVPLHITEVTVSDSAFSTSYAGGSVAPGDTVRFEVAYDGSSGEAEGVVLLNSDDPDEDPLAIQVFGRTRYLDPGEEAVDFTLPLLRRDPLTGEYVEEQFTLSDHRGKIVWFSVYASW